MKNLIILAAVILTWMSCGKTDFDLDNPDVKQFVHQIKSGSYNKYDLGVNGENLWTKMPNFRKDHIRLLLNYANDTSFICPCNHFPTNPVSSIPPYRMQGERECIMVGEYLLWCVQGIIEGNTFASLTPILIKTDSAVEEESLSGKEILEVRKLYLEWWEEYSKSGDLEPLPLDGTVYRWR